MQKNLYIVVILGLFLLNGCNDEKKQEKNEVTIKKPLPHLSSTEEKDNQALNTIGISTNSDKIIIDTNKTKEFLKNLANTLKQESKELQEKTKDLGNKKFGIQKENGKIVIDLNKTKKTLQGVTKELEGVANSLGNIFGDQSK